MKVILIGAGIQGIATALDLAHRGKKEFLLGTNDWDAVMKKELVDQGK